MIKFRNLLFKEIKELITKQFIISIVMMLAIFYFVGAMAKTEAKKAESRRKISVMDLDRSVLSQGITSTLQNAKFDIKWINGNNIEEAVREAGKSDTNLLLVIPSGFGDSIERFDPEMIHTYTFLRSFSISSIGTSAIIQAVISATNNYLSDNVLKKKVPEISPDVLKNPIKSRDFVIVKDKTAEGSASAVTSMVFSQSILVPIVLFFIIMTSSQMVIAAIAMEKQNKTLETLLTVPIPRISIVTTKMLAAGVVGLISAAIYMGGMSSMLGGLEGGGASSTPMSSVIKELGLTMSGDSFLLLGASIFLAILCGLAMATILGVLAEDFRSAQSLLLPIVLMILVPYLLSIFADINTLPLPVKLFVLAIPFSHPFLATQSIMLGQYSTVLYGILYMAVVFFILVVLAARIFSTDRVLTMKLRWRKKTVVL
jgi:ABC-2 type transport system permease protein